MNRIPSPRLGLLVPALFIAIVGGNLALPSAVRAECGDYVHMARPSAAPLETIQSIPAKPVSAPKPQQGPCPGPYCSSHGSMPLLPPASPPTTVQEQWGCMIGVMAPPELNLYSARFEQIR